MSSVFPTRSDTNRAVQSMNMARGLKFRIQEVEGLYYPCSENKGAAHVVSVAGLAAVEDLNISQSGSFSYIDTDFL